MSTPNAEKFENAQEGLWPYILKRALPAGIFTGSIGYAINRAIVSRSATVAARSVSARSLLLMGSFLMGFVTTTEVYSLKYERAVLNKVNDISEDRLGSYIGSEQKLPETVTDRVLNYVNENRFKAFVTVWASSIGAAGWAVSRDKYMTAAQKVVLARMYAQGFTLLLIVGSAGIAMMESDSDKPKQTNHGYADNSWKKLIEENPSESK
ncbi:uncharacterized protein V1516DRAFT_676900 [Lipomyces oligophaga]|uniref:uncharacterized protein n=1 Tax=Lipomyces oligophaga TaxID=45792 RepID=UPI0034CE0B39